MASGGKSVLVTGSSGLIGSEAVLHFDRRGWRVLGLDNNMRADFFGPGGDTTPCLRRLVRETKRFRYFDLDVRDRAGIFALFERERPAAIVHCAAQPSHDLSRDRTIDDFEVNATGTLNLLEAARNWVRDSPFVFMSTNKVYGDAPNEMPLEERETRYDYARPEDWEGVAEDCRVDACLHSPFGASKLAADVLTQEYGRYFDMPTTCLRGGCLTGPQHRGVELHGFLSYLVKVALAGGTYRIQGSKGKQVRDQIHSEDVVRAIEAVLAAPRPAAVYNLGGGRGSNASILECVAMIEERIGRKIDTSTRRRPGWGITSATSATCADSCGTTRNGVASARSPTSSTSSSRRSGASAERGHGAEPCGVKAAERPVDGSRGPNAAGDRRRPEAGLRSGGRERAGVLRMNRMDRFRPKRLTRVLACAALAAFLLAAPATADNYDDQRAAHPLRIAAYVVHPVGFALDWLLFRPAHWVVSHQPFKAIFGHQEVQ